MNRFMDFDLIHGKDEVIGSIPIGGSSENVLQILDFRVFEGFFIPLTLKIYSRIFTLFFEFSRLLMGLNGTKINLLFLVQ